MNLASHDPGSDLRRPRVAVVDDDPLSRSLLARLLQMLGYEAVALADPEAAAALALSGDIDAMLLDLSMPRVDGFEVLRTVREREAQAQRVPLPVIAVTGYAAEADRQRCLLAGFMDHLSKPVLVDPLRASLERCLREKLDPARPPTDAVRVAATAQRLAQVKKSSGDFQPTVLEAFALNSSQRVEELQRAATRADAANLARSAGKLRDSAEYMGALALADLARRAHQSATRGDVAAVRELLAVIADEHQTVLALLLRNPGSTPDFDSHLTPPDLSHRSKPA